ncbi:MAG: tandem-95 repeat protein [Thermoplasmatales archaeon]|nr:tandem-95 repeat protein [Thermoplasmatales archaeon]
MEIKKFIPLIVSSILLSNLILAQQGTPYTIWTHVDLNNLPVSGATVIVTVLRTNESGIAEEYPDGWYGINLGNFKEWEVGDEVLIEVFYEEYYKSAIIVLTNEEFSFVNISLRRNNPPVANDDYYTTNEDTKLTVNAPGVLGNDSDADGDTLTAVLVNGPTHGSLTLNSNGSFTYTPHANYSGQDSFTYKAYDGQDYSNISTVYITITPVNDPPVANNDYCTTDEDTPVIINILENDYDIDGTIDASSVTITQNASHGNVTVNANGTVTYTPNANYHGSDSFKYKVKDNSNAWSNEATVFINITPVNDVPNKPLLVTPANNSLNLSTNANLTVHVVDIDGNLMNVSFYGRKLGNVTWQLIGTKTNVANNTDTSITWYNLAYNTTYEWYAIANDSIAETSSDTWIFTTIVYTPPSPPSPPPSPPFPPPPENKPPKCSLQVNISEGYAPLVVNFIINASDEDGYIAYWELDIDNDGITEYNGSGSPPSTKQHSYNNTGNYTAKLTVTDDKGAKSNSTIAIIVKSNVYFEFSPARPAPGVNVYFSAIGEGVNYSWNFGDGSIGYGRNVTHAFDREGKYRVKLSVFDGAYYHEVDKLIYVIIPDFSVEASYLPDKPKKGDEITLILKIKNDGGYCENVKCSVFLDGRENYSIFNIYEEYEKEIHFKGVSKIKIIVDPYNEIEERNEKNNELEISIKYGKNNFIYFVFIPLLAIPAYLLLRKKKVFIEEEKVEKCSVCLGSFKQEANILKCNCGALYHRSCAKRVGNCINCGKKL